MRAVSCDNSASSLPYRSVPLSQEFPINVAVIGVGAFGRNHARVYRQLQDAGSVRLVGVVDPDTSRADAVAREFDCKSFGSVEQMLTTHSEVQAASVAVPTVLHLEVARSLMEAGVDVLIEKPLAATLAEADELLRVASTHKRVAQVGHLERFNPAVRATLPLINRPMFFEVHRLSVFSPRALDVDVVLDLMIHDLDIVLALARGELKEIRAAGISVLSPKVDIANVRLEFSDGCVANLTASRVSTDKVRKLRLFQPRQYISVDYAKQAAAVFSVGGPEGIAFEQLPIESAEPLKLQFDAFLDSVETRRAPKLDGSRARHTLEIALAVLAKIEEHASVVAQTLASGWKP